MSRPSVKRKLDSSFTHEEIELPASKKICLNPPQLFTSYPTDIWNIILLKLCKNCVLDPDTMFRVQIIDYDTYISLSETCKYFKYILDQPFYENIIKQVSNVIIEYLDDCNDFFEIWDETKDYGTIKRNEFHVFISQYSYHTQIVIFKRIYNLHKLIPINFKDKVYEKPIGKISLDAIINYNEIKKQWENFLKLFPKEMIFSMKKNIYYQNLFS